MILDFSWLPPEINSARIYAGPGPVWCRGSGSD
ncbi:hypothetical protein W080_04055, partial [Mycobacterium tuberculosis TB_RSA170]